MCEPSVRQVIDVRAASLELPAYRGQFGLVDLCDTICLRQAPAIESRRSLRRVGDSAIGISN